MSPRPFLFDRAFDSLDDGDAATAAGAGRPPSYDEAALAAAREEAFAEGFAQGQAEGLAKAETAAQDRAAAARDAIAAAMPTAIAGADRAEAAAASAAAAAAARALAVAFPTFAHAHGQAEILAVLREALSRAIDEPRIVARLAADDFEAVESELDQIAHNAGFAGRIVSLEDTGVASGDVRLEWADGGLARDLGRLTAAIADALNQLARTTGDASTETPTEPAPEEAGSAPAGA